jgi:4-amino-4-deoxy-L-arabinose transferase-like glycosyltransferase
MDEPAGRLAPSRHRVIAASRPWRSPPDQPAWARPALLGVAALAALTYAWGMSSAALDTSYGAIARSMSSSWHDFLFGAFDPAGTVTVDKLPGALWPQALALRLFGFHVWAAVLPQVIEGTLTVLVLFRVMRRLAGPVAGLTAAAILAASPVTVALNRGNVPDSLLILLSVLAADATVAAIVGGRPRSLLLAGAWVGLAFQAKMLQAWAILPALAIAYLVCAPARLRVRTLHVAGAGAACLAVSVSWMTIVSLVPAGERPYVDGTRNDSVFSQVFDYNGVARLEHGSNPAGAGPPAAFLTRVSESGAAAKTSLAESVPPGWSRLLDGVYGRDIGWLLPAALIAALGTLIARRGSGRRDLYRGSVLLWGTWLLLLWGLFSDGIYLHSYYVASLVPALAGLCATGVALAWPRRRQAHVRAIIAGALLAGAAYGVYLLHGGTGVPSWLTPTSVCAALAGALAMLAVGPGTRSRALAGRTTIATLTCVLLVPAVASALMVTRALGPFAAPFEPPSATPSAARAKLASAQSARFVAELNSVYRTPIVFAIDTSRLAAPFIFASGREILPIGGFEGGIPSPTLAQLQRDVSSGRLRAFLIPASSPDPRLRWVYRHCRRTGSETGGEIHLLLYECEPSRAERQRT